jgi:hypothetical protein
MKWLGFLIFCAAFVASLTWIDSDELKLTRAQQSAVGVAALAAWTLMVALGAVMP